MTMDLSIGASSDKTSDWKAIQWPTVRRHVRRLQLRIAKAIRAGKHGKAKALQWLLTHSRSAKMLAVRRVTGNNTEYFERRRCFAWRTYPCGNAGKSSAAGVEQAQDADKIQQVAGTLRPRSVLRKA